MIGLSICLLSATLTADPEMWVTAAQEQYEAGLRARNDQRLARVHFLSAARYYESLVQTGYRNVAVFRNLAQCHLLAGDLAAAIASYRQGLRIEPGNRELLAGLTYARSLLTFTNASTVEEAAKMRTLRSWYQRFSVPGIFGAALGLYLGGWLLLARWRMVRRPDFALWGAIFLVLSSGLAVWAWTAETQLQKEADAAWAIVRTESTLHTGNSEEYPARLDGQLPIGVEVRLVTERGGWQQVELANGTIGWLPQRRLFVIPTSPTSTR